MNCQDISRIADTGSFSHLPEAQRQAAEAHALTCRHCAPVWAAHVRLAELRIPAMPGELPARFRTLAAVPVQARGRAGLRRLTVVGGVVVLAAAAAMLAFQFRDGRAPQDSQAEAMVPSATELALAPAAQPPEGAASVVADDATSSAVPEKDAAVAAQSDESLPLLLPPDNSGPERAVDLALQKVADSHPELVGSEVDGIFTVTMLTRANGTLVSSDVQLIPPGPAAEELYRKARAEQSQAIADAGNQQFTMRARNAVLPDGRSLSAEVRSQLGVVPDNYDMTRSRARVLAVVRQQHSNLALPATGSELNRLTILLTEDGSIERQVVEKRARNSAQNSSPLPTQGGEAGMANQLAEFLVQDIARSLMVSVDQIGQVGIATLEVGDFSVVVDESGSLQRRDNRRVLNVAYAWPRRDGETSPTFALPGPYAPGGPTLQSKFDVAAALTILKRKIPDAFIVKAEDAGTPALFLSHKGELIRAGRVRAPGSGAVLDTVLIQQLAPGARLGASMGRTIEDGARGSTRVVFAWEEDPEVAATR